MCQVNPILEKKKNRQSENLDKEEAPNDLPVVENCKEGTSQIEENVPKQR